MPIIKSAKKRVKVTATKAARNKAFRSALKTTVKNAVTSIENNAADSKESVCQAIKKIDQAAAKGILHKNTAARKKSALARRLNSINK